MFQKTQRNVWRKKFFMILCIDVGNTNIKYGIFDGDRLAVSFRVATDLKRTSDEYGTKLIDMMAVKGITAAQIDGAIVSSVIPSLNYTISHMCSGYLDVEPILVGPGTKTEHNLRVDNAREVGADRIVNDIAAIKKYGSPLIVIDFGTATTFNIINEQREFIGGVIAPGIRGSMDSLVNSTAKLPRVEIEIPRSVIGKNTTTNMQAGIVFGFAGLVDYIVKKIKKEMKCPAMQVVATGGFSEIIAHEISCIDHVDKLLTLQGLKYLYDLNRTEVKSRWKV